MPRKCHVLFPLCGCKSPALTAEGAAVVRAAIAPDSGAGGAIPAVAPQEETHAGPAPRVRRTAAPPWSPNYRDPVTGEYPNRQAQAARDAELADFEARVLAAMQNPELESSKKLFAEIAAEDARNSFAEFFRQAWHVVDPGTELVWNWHLALMCAVVQVVFFDWLKGKRDKKYYPKVRNVIFNVPPGSSKSRVLSVMFQAWAWLHCPSMKFLCLSVNDDAMLRDARACRDLLQSPWFQKSFQPTWTLKDDQVAASNYAITGGGDRISMPCKSEIVGLRADCLLIDDPNNPKKAENESERKEINTLWSSNQFNRVNDMAKSLRIGVQQRTHEDDWTGNVVQELGLWTPPCGNPKKCKKQTPEICCNRDGWLHIVLPAEYESARKFVMPELLQRDLRAMNLAPEDHVVEDPRTEEGESLDPVRLSDDVLAGERKRWRGTNSYAGQMQQRPASSEGNKISSKWWGWCKLAGGVRDDLDALGISGASSAEGRPRPAGCHDGEAKIIHQRHYSPGEWDFDWITISIDCASKKPCHVDGLVVVRDRGTIRLGDVNAGDYILTHNGRYRRVLSVAEQGELPLVCLNTYRGRAVKVAPSHPMLTQRGWIEAGDVVVGDVLAETHSSETCLGGSNISNEEARLIGYLLGDGCLTKNEPAAFTNIDETTQADFKYCAESIGLKLGKRRKVHPGRKTSDVGILAGDNCEGFAWVDKHELRGKDSYTKRVPKAVLQSSDEAVANFLAAYWACDGCISKRKDNRSSKANPSTTVIVNSVSRELLRDVQHLLSRLGISMTLRKCVSKMKTKRQGDTHVSWRLSSADQDTVAKFMERVAPLIRHAKRDKAPNAKRVDFDRVLTPDAVASIEIGETGQCRCLEVQEDHSFVYEDVAVHNTEKGSNYGILVVAGKGGQRFILDDATQRGALHEIIEVLVGSDANPERPRDKGLVQKWRPTSILIEDKAAGDNVMDTLREQMAAGDVPMVTIETCDPGNADKEMRLEAATPYIKMGQVFLLDGADWLEEFVEEFRLYPAGKRDDRVDALSQILNWKRAADDELPPL